MRAFPRWHVLYDRWPFGIFRALMDQATKKDSGLTRGEAYEIMEGMIPDRLRSI